MLRLLCAIILLAVLSPTVSADELMTCPDDRIAIANPFPKYPSPDEASAYFGHSTAYVHVFVGGTVTVSFTVSSSGKVETIKVADSTYNLAGRDRNSYEDGYFDDFHPANVVRTVKRWKFSPVDYSCQMTRKFSWKMGD